MVLVAKRPKVIFSVNVYFIQKVSILLKWKQFKGKYLTTQSNASSLKRFSQQTKFKYISEMSSSIWKAVRQVETGY